MSSRLRPLDGTEFAALTADVVVPVEQSLVWDAYDRAMPGRRPWKRFAFEVDGRPAAVIALSEYRGRGFRYLWAKHGPVWMCEPTAELERALRTVLVAGVRAVDPGIAFVRLHARHGADDLHELLQSVTYDRTVVVHLDSRSDDDLLAGMKKRGRRDLRKGQREHPVEVREETGLTADDFAELYAVLQETAERDGFGIHPASVYTTMLDALGPGAARVFVGRHDGAIESWVIVTVHDAAATAYYAASSAAGRASDAATQLYWEIIRTLRDEGVRTFDFMGIGSDRAPSLESLTTMKTKFTPEVTAVDGAWDVAVRPLRYAALTRALALKRAGVRAVREAVPTARGALGAARRALGAARRPDAATTAAADENAGEQA
ncbi:lipid II:glycine glycyltransferase FemX [Georgenia faecalis]|uniref:Lipid II:glycine glycyltransferase FemX n=1 Tax=Georgenia faecalis TaxID=2483799 RepID=A0ABV9DCN5_9MICO|nr:GNAT family N-acetyltransferase [Georgenia faecalis]